jgi:trans-aconitate methyltransferase
MSGDSNYDLIEEDFNHFLDQSLAPRRPKLLYELVAELPPERGRQILGLGCGKGRHSIELAKRFAAIVHGVDPDPYSLAGACRALAEVCWDDHELRDLVRFAVGSAENIRSSQRAERAHP